MTKTPSKAAAMSSRLFATRLQLPIITLVVLSIGLLWFLALNREAHSPTMGRLRSSWFVTLTRSGHGSETARS
jgi:hypothetical protein